MKAVFVDTCHFIATLSPRDQWHSRAVELERQLDDFEFVTTDFVILELLNYFCGFPIEAKAGVVKTVQQLLVDPEIDVLACTHEVLLAGLSLYEARLDKGYSLTDCVSMNAMREHGISHVLTHDGILRRKGLRFSCNEGPPSSAPILCS